MAASPTICSACGDRLGTSRKTILEGRTYHAQCVMCSVCETSLTDIGGGHVACPQHPFTPVKFQGRAATARDQSTLIGANASCAACGKTVYYAEQFRAMGKAWHQACFKCADIECRATLRSTTYETHQGMPYCRGHVPKSSTTTASAPARKPPPPTYAAVSAAPMSFFVPSTSAGGAGAQAPQAPAVIPAHASKPAAAAHKPTAATTIAKTTPRVAQRDEPQVFRLLEKDRAGRLRVTDEGRARLASITRGVRVVSIVGSYRLGKSYLMSRLAGFDRCIFPVSHGADGFTTGIWGAVTDTGEETTLWLDTEGLDDAGVSQVAIDQSIFSFAILLSSSVIYNVSDNIKEADIQKLAAMSELARIVAPTRAGSGELRVLLPHLLWVIRDAKPAILKGGHNLYLSNVLKSSTTDLARRTLSSFFGNIGDRNCTMSCVAMPRPSYDPTELENEAASPEFELAQKGIQAFLLASVGCKMLPTPTGEQRATGASLLALLEYLCSTDEYRARTPLSTALDQINEEPYKIARDLVLSTFTQVLAQAHDATLSSTHRTPVIRRFMTNFETWLRGEIRISMNAFNRRVVNAPRSERWEQHYSSDLGKEMSKIAALYRKQYADHYIERRRVARNTTLEGVRARVLAKEFRSREAFDRASAVAVDDAVRVAPDIWDPESTPFGVAFMDGPTQAAFATLGRTVEEQIRAEQVAQQRIEEERRLKKAQEEAEAERKRTEEVQRALARARKEREEEEAREAEQQRQMMFGQPVLVMTPYGPQIMLVRRPAFFYIG